MNQMVSYKEICKLAWPVTLSQSAIILSGMIDLAFIGPYGSNAIAAVSIANILAATLYNFFEGLRTGTTVLIAKTVAKNQDHKRSEVLCMGLALAFSIGLFVALLAPQISDYVYDLVGDSSIRFFGLDYLTIWLWGVPVTLIFYVVVGFFRGIGDTLTPLYATILICILNAIGDYFFVYGGLGITSMGVKGSAAATVWSYIVGTFFLVRLLKKKRVNIRNGFFTHSFIRRMSEYGALIVEIGFYTGFMAAVLVGFVYIISLLGAKEVAIHQITVQVCLLSYLPAMGFLVSASILIPRLLAARREEWIVKTVYRICVISFSVTLGMSGLLYFFAPNVAAFFSPCDEFVAMEAVKTLRLICIAQLFTALYMVLRGALTGCQDTRFIAYEGFISGYLIFLPAAYLLSIKMAYGVYGGYIAFLLWTAVDCMVFAYRFYCQKSWRNRISRNNETFGFRHGSSKLNDKH